MKIDYAKIVDYQKECKKNLSAEKAIEYIALTRELMHQAIDNNNQLPDNQICISNDFADDVCFYVFLHIYNRKIISISKTDEGTIILLD